MSRATNNMGPRLAVIFSRFPVWNQNFAVGDFVELDRAGFHIEIFTLQGQQGSFQQPEIDIFNNRVHRAYFLSPSLLWENIKALCKPITWRLFFASILGTLDHPTELLKTCVLFPQAIYFARLIKAKEIQHIHAAWASYPATAAWIASELTGIPFSFSSHAYDIYMVRSLLREKIEHSRFVITCAETNHRALLDAGGESARSKIFVHRHGTDLERFRPVAPSLDRAEPVWRILACGFLASYKGFVHLVGACAALRDQGYEFECLIIGEGPQRKLLIRQIEENGLAQRVRIAPPMPQAELAEHYHQADVFVHPSVITRKGNRDVIPNVLVEAMASGTPVVSTRLAGIQELIDDGKNGLLVSPGDPKALAEAIASLMQDSAKRERLVEAAQHTVAKAFDRRKNAKGLIQTFVAQVSPGGSSLSPKMVYR
ncbi:MAG: glycosyltransferase family 4 protein [Candidatus Binatia bacterium]